MKLNEGLRSGDLEHLVLPLLSIDEYKSKLGNDDQVIVVGFFVEDDDPAHDLSRFIEMGANNILDSEPSPAPNEDGYYIVFIECTRDSNFPTTLLDILAEIKHLVCIDEWKFKPYGHTKSVTVTAENIQKHVSLGNDKKIKEGIGDFLTDTFLNSVRFDHGRLIIDHRCGSEAYRIVNFGNENIIGAFETINLDDVSRRKCASLKEQLGNGWNVSLFDHTNIVISRADDDRVLVLSE